MIKSAMRNRQKSRLLIEVAGRHGTYLVYLSRTDKDYSILTLLQSKQPRAHIASICSQNPSDSHKSLDVTTRAVIQMWHRS